MKQLLFAAMLLASAAAFSQSATPVKKSISIQNALNEVVQEYFKNFEGSKGVILGETPSVVSYESMVSLPGASAAVIHKYSLPDTYSWEATLAETDEFDVAAKSYNQFFRQINNLKVAPNGYEKVQLTGIFDAPDEGRAFASTKFRLDTVKDDRTNFFVELGMQYEFPVWTVKIFLYEKMPDDEIRPGMGSLK